MTASHPRLSGDPSLVLVTGLPGTGKSTVAETIACLLGAPVLAHDWAMSGLRPYPEVQAALDAMEPSGHRVVGWSILAALARSQLRSGRSVVLDGVARAQEVEQCRRAASLEESACVVVATRCSDRVLHRSRIEDRHRRIPDWYELEWDQVAPAMDSWPEPEPEPVGLSLDSAEDWDANAVRLTTLFGR